MNLWTFEHTITLIPTILIMILITFVLNFFIGKKPLKVRLLPFQVLAVILVISEIIKQVLSIIQGYNLYYIPLHVCSLFIFLIPLFGFYKGKGEDIIKTLCCTVCVALFLFMIVSPNIIYSADNIKGFFKSYDNFHTVFFHNVVLFEFILIIGLNLYSVKEKKHLLPVLFLALGYSLVASSMAQILKTNFSNFYVCNIGPVNDFVNMVKEKWGYAVGQSIYVSILFILHIAFLMFSYKVFKFIETIKSKTTHKNSKQIKE